MCNAILPYLSIVVTSRNDDHGKNILKRTQSFLDSLAEQCARHRLQAELVVVEWNPPQRRPRLRQVLSPPLTSKFFTVRFVEVPSHFHAILNNSDKLPLFQMIAKNVGIRRAHGEFILATNVDIIFSEELMAFFAERSLEQGVSYRIDRYDLGVEILPQLYGPSMMEFCREQVVRVHGQYGSFQADQTPPTGPPDQLHTNGCGDFALMSQADWHKIKGYPELQLFSIFIDGLGVYAAQAVGIRQQVLNDPLRIYHIEHGLGWAVDKTTVMERPSLDYESEYKPLCKKMLFTKKPLSINGDNWGYALENFIEYSFQHNSTSEADIFQHWVDILSFIDKRLYYRDQSVSSFLSLLKLARNFRPTVIVELGTLGGMSLRTWLMAGPEAQVKAVDLSFDTLCQSDKLIPLDLSRVELIQTDILKLDFRKMWAEQDKVLFFVDAHDQPSVPIMQHVLKDAIPHLPEGSLVVVDDIWHSPEHVNLENAEHIFRERVLHEIDELQLFNPYYAPYHAGGTFWGFLEVQPLMHYINKHGIKLDFDNQAKHISFHTQKNPSITEFDCAAFQAQCGEIKYHPLADTVTGSTLADKIMPKIMNLYASGAFAPALDLLLELNKNFSECSGVAYAIGVILIRQGEAELALQALEVELATAKPHHNAARLFLDIQERFVKHRKTVKERRAGVTFFAVPKPFQGLEAIIQRNAILSWTKLTPRPEIILLGDDEGVADICMELGLKHEPDLKRNDCGTPLLDDLFFKAQQLADTEILFYVNADIILFNDIMQAISICSSQFEEFLLVGRRWDYDQLELIDFFTMSWDSLLKNHVTSTGVLHFPTGMDYFAFRPGLWSHIPPFALGRMAWDTWMLHTLLEKKSQVIDGTQFVTAFHQNHAYNHIPGGYSRLDSEKNIERNRNLALAGGKFPCGQSTLDAPLFMDEQGHIISRCYSEK